MLIKLSKRTKTRDILPVLTKEQLEDFMSKIPEVPLKTPILSMKISEFSKIIDDEEAFVNKILSKRRLFKALGLLKSYKRQMNELTKFIKMYEVKQTQEEKAAAVGILFPDLVSYMLLTVTKFYHLNSMKQAEKMKVSEFLIVFQEDSSGLLYQRNYNKIMQAKNKPPKK